MLQSGKFKLTDFNCICSLPLKVKLASKLPASQTYAVFRKGVVPDWEDSANKDGGRWQLHYDKRERASRLDDRWMEVLLMALGNHLTSAVTGVYIKLIIF